MFGAERTRRSTTSVAGVSAAIALLAVLVLVDPGYQTPDVELHDSGVWVTRSSALQLGRFNYEAQSVDAAVVAGSADLDVLQHDDLVLLTDDVADTVSVIDPAIVEPAGAVALGEGKEIALGGATVAIWEAEGGAVWAMPAAELASFDPESAAPVAEISRGGAVAVGLDGAVYVADPGTATLTTLTFDGELDKTSTRDLNLSDGTNLSLTAVGSTPVVLDRDGGRLLHGSQSTSVSGSALVLQEPGPAADAIAFSTADGLVEQPLDGTEATLLPADGDPVAPVRTSTCTYGAWSNGDVVRDCGGDVFTANLPSSGSLRYRVNRGYVVLNDLVTGTVWLADQDFEELDGWDDLESNTDTNDDETDDVATEIDDILRERDLPNRPPVATDDSFGVRPGRTTILTVLDNDTDPDGDILRATPDNNPEFATVQAILNGAALQADVPADASGTATFDYTLDDGRENGTDTATVTLVIHGDDVNGPPARLRPTIATVEQGKTVAIDALADWRDPDGDVLRLADASTSGEGDSVQFTADGKLTFSDAGTEITRKSVTIVVSDGREVTEGELLVDVVPIGENRPPVAVVDHVSAVAGRALTITPVGNDTDPNDDVLRLARVDDVAGVSLARNFEIGEITFTAATAGVYYLTYLVTDGPLASVGLIRVDVVSASEEFGTPVAVRDRALLPSDGSVLVDVLANDSDPTGNVLVVQSVDVDPDSGVSVAVLNHAVLRVSSTNVGTQPFALHYTVSNGGASARGEVIVLPILAEGESQSPQAKSDEVTVRANDVVTIDVLHNDFHPDALPMTVEPELVETPDPAAGSMFVSENTVRFQAGEVVQTVYATYSVRDEQGHQDSAQITVHVAPANGDNSAPSPTPVTARMIAGEVYRIAIPLTGIDPDGDSVELTGLTRAPTRGRVTAIGDGWIEYEAARGAVGTDSFGYLVTDRRGATGEGQVLVGIAPAQFANQPPIAVDDHRVVRPNREIAVSVLANDVDPEGDTLGLFGSPQAAGGLVAEYDAGQVVVHTGSELGVFGVRYEVHDGTSSAEGMLTVEVTPDAPTSAPIARDDRLSRSEVAGRRSVQVSVLDNDEDPDGATSALRVSTPVEDVRVVGGSSLSIPVLESSRVVAYTAVDPDGNQATAFVWVPGASGAPPTLRAGLKPLEVVSGEELLIDLSDQVAVEQGHTVRITQAERIVALRGTGSAVDSHTIRYICDDGYYGPAAITFEVIDTDAVDDPTGRTATLSIPVEVLPSGDEPPELAGLEVSAARGERTEVDLTRYAADPNDDPLTFAVEDLPAELSAHVDGHLLILEPSGQAAIGAALGFTLVASDGSHETTASARVLVTSSNMPLATVVDDSVPDANQGQTYTVSVLDNDVAPVEDSELTVTASRLESGTGTVSNSARTVTVTPGDNFVGTMVISYTVQDFTQDAARQVTGRVRVTVRGVPDAPGTPTVVEVRSHTAVVSWAPPNNNGAPITGYRVRGNGTGATTTECPATTCTVSGLTNGRPYTFSVVAVNEVGESASSPRSAEIVPDEIPDPPDAPTLTFGDGSLTVQWANRNYGGERSPIESVNLEISPPPASGVAQRSGVAGTSIVWTGLTNGTAYRVRIQSVNDAGPSPWGAYSASEVPAGVPDPPGTPTTSMLSPVGGQAQMQVSWTAPASDNGDPVTNYTLHVLRGGTTVHTIAAGTALTRTVTAATDETGYTYRVVATNKAGDSAPSAPSAERRAVVPPDSPSSATASATGHDGQVAVSVSPLSAAQRNGARASEVSYQYSLGAGWAALSSPSSTIGGLNNGQSYTISVRARTVVDGAEYFSPATSATYSGANSSGAGVRPYGPLRAVSADVSTSGTNVSVAASVADNGCGTVLYYRYWNDTAGSAPNYSSSASRTFSTGASSTHSQTWRVQAYGSDSCGQSSSGSPVSDSATTSAPPAPTLALLRGDSMTNAECVHASCAYLSLRYTDITGTYTVRFHDTHPPAGVFATKTVTFNGSGIATTDAFYGYPGESVWAEVVGVVTSPRITW